MRLEQLEHAARAARKQSEPGGYQSPTTQSLSAAKRAARCEVLQEGDFEHLDPGIAYYSVDYMVVFATQRPLYSNKPNTASEASPDMASGAAGSLL